MGKRQPVEQEEPRQDVLMEIDDLPPKYTELDTRKKEMLVILLHCWPNVAEACRVMGVARQTFYNWKADDELFAEALDHLHEARLDMVESKVHQIALSNHQQSLTACIFLLNTQRGDRFARQSKRDVHITHEIADPLDMSGYVIDITEESQQIEE